MTYLYFVLGVILGIGGTVVALKVHVDWLKLNHRERYKELPIWHYGYTKALEDVFHKRR